MVFRIGKLLVLSSSNFDSYIKQRVDEEFGKQKAELINEKDFNYQKFQEYLQINLENKQIINDLKKTLDFKSLEITEPYLNQRFNQTLDFLISTAANSDTGLGFLENFFQTFYDLDAENSEEKKGLDLFLKISTSEFKNYSLKELRALSWYIANQHIDTKELEETVIRDFFSRPKEKKKYTSLYLENQKHFDFVADFNEIESKTLEHKRKHGTWGKFIGFLKGTESSTELNADLNEADVAEYLKTAKKLMDYEQQYDIDILNYDKK